MLPGFPVRDWIVCRDSAEKRDDYECLRNWTQKNQKNLKNAYGLFWTVMYNRDDTETARIRQRNICRKYIT